MKLIRNAIPQTRQGKKNALITICLIHFLPETHDVMIYRSGAKEILAHKKYLQLQNFQKVRNLSMLELVRFLISFCLLAQIKL